MAASRNRGRKKPKLRDYSHLVLTAEEKEAVSAAAHSVEQHPIVTAILGSSLVEHEVDILLRRKLKKKDDDTWRELQDENGPLRSFFAKISMGYALGIFEDKIQHDLNIVRTIRNAFAHSKKLLEFDDPLIIPELLGARLLPAKFKKYLREKSPGNQLAKASFIIICLKLQGALFRKQTRAANARYYRLRRKVPISALANALLGNPYGTPLGSPYALLHSSDPKSDSQSSQGDRGDRPNPSTPKGYVNALRPFLDDKKK